MNCRNSETLNRTWWLTPLCFIVLGFLLYSNTMDVPFYLDDMRNISQNEHVRLTKLSWNALRVAAFDSPCPHRPVANLSFALNYYFHQDDVTGYHIVNIIIHILTGIFLYLFIKTTLQILSHQSLPASIISFFAALVWLVHPIQTQSVTYIVQRMNGMSAMFYLLSLVLYVRGRLVKESPGRYWWFAGCIVAGLLAIGSKEIAATLPFYILLYEWFFLQGLSTDWLKRRLPYIIGALAILACLSALYLGSSPWETILSGYKNRDFTLMERVFTEFRVVILYISLLMFPHPSRLNMDHAFPVSHSVIDPSTTLASMGTIVVLVIVAVYLARRERLISFCILWFLGNLVIESSIIGLEIVFEHRTYLPSIGFVVIIVVLVFRYIRKIGAAIGVAGLLVVVLSAWTYSRNSMWADPIRFWRDSAGKSERKVRPHFNLANALAKQGMTGRAVIHYLKALEIDSSREQVHYNLGLALAKQGKLDEAASHFLQVLEIKPDSVEVHNNLGNVFLEKGDINKASFHYLKAVRLAPTYAAAHYNLATALVRQGNFNEAISHYSKALQIRPGFRRAEEKLRWLRRQGRQ